MTPYEKRKYQITKRLAEDMLKSVNNRRRDSMARCQELLEIDTVETSKEPDPADSLPSAHCGSERLRLIETTAKPSWKDLFWRPVVPAPSGKSTSRQSSTHDLSVSILYPDRSHFVRRLKWFAGPFFSVLWRIWISFPRRCTM
jgi:hypothetical protein